MDARLPYIMDQSSASAYRNHRPHTPCRPSTSSGRPGTSSGPYRPLTGFGETIQPNSIFLRDALSQRKGPPRARSATPKKARPMTKSQPNREDIAQSSADEKDSQDKPPPRPTRPRRMSELSYIRRNTPPISGKSVEDQGVREAESRLDKLEKENWDLKHRIALYQERSKLLTARLEGYEADVEALAKAEERIKSFKDQIQLLTDQLDTAKDNNFELTHINEELVRQLEFRDKELEMLENDSTARQAAIEEAAGIIQHLEQQILEREDRSMTTQFHRVVSARQSSGYSSGDSDSLQTMVQFPLSKLVSRRPSHSADSDYFSADTSPLATPKTAKTIVASIESDSPQLNATFHNSKEFDRDLGLQSLNSKDSLLSSYLENPQLPQPSGLSARFQQLRSLRRRVGQSKPSKVSENTSRRNFQPPAQADVLPLYNLYAIGEVGACVNSMRPASQTIVTEPGKSYSPSLGQQRHVTGTPEDACSMISDSNHRVNQRTSPNVKSHVRTMHTRSNSTNSRSHAAPLIRPDSLSIGQTSRPGSSRGFSAELARSSFGSSNNNHLRLAAHAHKHRASTVSPSCQLRRSTGTSTVANARCSPSAHSIPPAQTALTYSTTKPTTITHRSPPTPNFSMWPKRYPAWPPSAGLVNRDLLFHGHDMDKLSTKSIYDDEIKERHW